MIKPFCFCILALLLAGCSRPERTVAARKTVGDLAVMLTTDPPPHVGDNTLAITLGDAGTQAPVGNANITATPEMLSPSDVGSSTSGRAQGNGLYTIPVRLGIATRYDINLHIERPGKPAVSVSFPIEAAQ